MSPGKAAPLPGQPGSSGNGPIDSTGSIDLTGSNQAPKGGSAGALVRWRMDMREWRWDAAEKELRSLNANHAQTALRELADSMARDRHCLAQRIDIGAALARLHPLSQTGRKGIARKLAALSDCARLLPEIMSPGEFPSLAVTGPGGGSMNALSHALSQQHWDTAEALVELGVEQSPMEALHMLHLGVTSQRPKVLAALWERAKGARGDPRSGQESDLWFDQIALQTAFGKRDLGAAQWILERSCISAPIGPNASPQWIEKIAEARGRVMRNAVIGGANIAIAPAVQAWAGVEACAAAFGSMRHGGSTALGTLAYVANGAPTDAVDSWLSAMDKAWALGAGEEDGGAEALVSAQKNPRVRAWLKKKGAVQAKPCKALLSAADRENPEFFFWLVENGADLNVDNLLATAAHRGEPRMFEFLASRPNGKKELDKALAAAAGGTGRAVERMERLEKLGADPRSLEDWRTDRSVESYPMADAARAGNAAALEWLIQRGALPKGRGRSGLPTRKALENGHVQAAEILLDAGGLTPALASRVSARHLDWVPPPLREPFERACAQLERAVLLKAAKSATPPEPAKDEGAGDAPQRAPAPRRRRL